MVLSRLEWSSGSLSTISFQVISSISFANGYISQNWQESFHLKRFLGESVSTYAISTLRYHLAATSGPCEEELERKMEQMIVESAKRRVSWTYRAALLWPPIYHLLLHHICNWSLFFCLMSTLCPLLRQVQTIQRCWRGFVGRRYFVQLRKATLTLQAWRCAFWAFGLGKICRFYCQAALRTLQQRDQFLQKRQAAMQMQELEGTYGFCFCLLCDDWSWFRFA